MSAESNEIVIGANIIIPELNTGTITNSYGFYSITISEGTYKLEISSIGFKTINETIELQKDTKQNFYLEENIESLDEVIVTQNAEEIDIRKPIMSLNILSNQTIKPDYIVVFQNENHRQPSTFLALQSQKTYVDW